MRHLCDSTTATRQIKKNRKESCRRVLNCNCIDGQNLQTPASPNACNSNSAAHGNGAVTTRFRAPTVMRQDWVRRKNETTKKTVDVHYDMNRRYVTTRHDINDTCLLNTDWRISFKKLSLTVPFCMSLSFKGPETSLSVDFSVT